MPEAVPRPVPQEADLPVAAGGPGADLDSTPPPPNADPEVVEQFRERMLLRRLRHGEERAFAELVKANQDRVFDLVFRMIGDREEALDLSQEVFVAVHAAVGRFRGESRLSTWIFRVAKNHCLNRLKYLGRRERGRSTEISDVPEAVLERNAPSLRPDDAASVNETRTMVQQAIAELDEEHRLLVVLRDVEGLSYHEIAAITDQPEGTVKSRLHRARAALAEIIAKLERE
ncbi:MAG TPA: sigma-70 family RNA polymerase sigma factor [Myxococcales bacterium]|jgi:RNA polymerase sigma-70 factor (ECF subfamily)